MKKTIIKKLSFTARTIKTGLAMAIPVLFIGSITVLLNSFPVQAYQDFLDSFLGGAFRNIILTVQTTTVGILAIHITIALNFAYMNQTEEGQRPVFRFGSLLSCLTGFFIIVGIFWDRELSLLSGQGVFSAMLAGIIGSMLFRKFESMFNSQKMIFVDGADSEFNSALHLILPFMCVTLCFAGANYLITVLFDVQSVQHLFMKAMDAIFIKMHRSYSSGLLFTSLTSIMWWFGIHGNNVLNQVAEDMFTAIIPGQIVSKSFIDTFVNMGGTGCTIGMLFAIIIFGRRNSTKKLSGMAFFPAMFNIGELLVFGYPIIYNPLMAIPFILAPILCFSNAFLMTVTGFMPPVINEVAWTTPAIMSGYVATGSARGVIVQIANILISIGCYAPFVIMCEKRSVDKISPAMGDLVGIMKKSEETSEAVTLTGHEGNIGRLAKHLAMDLEVSLSSFSADDSADNSENPLLIHYQPQYDSEGKCTGAEALLRWNHKLYGIIYPPLAIRIARESGDLFKLETGIIERTVYDSAYFRQCFGDDFVLSVNVTVSTLKDRRFIPFLQSVADRYRLKTGNICLEITEDAELARTAQIDDLINRIRTYGFILALDDFSMGHNSIQYLQHEQFDIVKLDGSLVNGVIDNDRTKEIINSIVHLSESLDFKVVAECVETTEQRDALKQIGSLLYQGFLFSPAVDKSALASMAQRREAGQLSNEIH